MWCQFAKNNAWRLSSVQFSSVQLISRVRLFATPWTAAHQASLPIINSWSPPKPMSIESMMPSNHLILCHPLSCFFQSFPTSGSFQMTQLFASCGQNIGVSASTSVLPMNIQNWFPLRLTDLVSLQSKGLLVEINFAQLKFQQKVMTKVNEDFKRSWKFPWLLEIIMV